MFRRVLVANRGEIALRVIRACSALGVESVAVYSDADRGAPWLDEADRACCIGPGTASQSYLDAEAILQAGEQCDCQAVHPGYGFLSENAVFAARCEQQGLTFIGPDAASIRRMGDKAEAKRTMREAGLQTIPGSEGRLSDAAEAKRLAAEIGYPLLLKATAGGGGRGMRRCADETQLAAAFAEASIEAQKAFGDPSLYLEKLLRGARHVEFQVIADGRGAAVHVGERECSIQRKHQKLLEEAPSPAVSREERERVGRAVAAAVGASGYRNVGTVEFLRDAEGNFYFMEMNTRLQVEHPVTEMVAGIDLVEWQLRLAACQPLTLRQEQIDLSGHAVELRINAEDPERGFQPDPGRVVGFAAPRLAASDHPGARVRWDSALVEGYRMPPHYDSLLGKLIVHAADRPAALSAARAALDSLRIEGIRTTAAFHARLLEAAEFREGRYDTEYLERSGLLSTSG